MNLICSRILCVKNQLLCLATVFLLGGVATSQNQPTAGVQASVGEIGAGTVSLTAKGVLPKPPLFFNATANAKVRVTASAVNHDIALDRVSPGSRGSTCFLDKMTCFSRYHVQGGAAGATGMDVLRKVLAGHQAGEE